VAEPLQERNHFVTIGLAELLRALAKEWTPVEIR